MASKTFVVTAAGAALVLGFALSWPSPAHAAAPTQLYNKSIIITWAESGTYKRMSDGSDKSTVGQFQMTVYVSSAGRPFVRASNRAGQFANTRERGPENNSGNVQFSGNTLTTVRENIGVARQLQTTFDGSFSSCSTSVTIGKIGPGAKMTGFDGAIYQVVSMQPSATSCSIREGNALAN